MVDEVEKFRVYKNAPKCKGCGVQMRYMYTHVASNRSVWKCDDCLRTAVTDGYPEDDDPDSICIIPISGYMYMPENNEHTKIRESIS